MDGKVIGLAAGALLLAVTATAYAARPYGVWLRPSTGSQVRFYPCGGKLCGKVVAVRDKSRRKEIGVVIMPGAVKSGANSWAGDLLDAGTGKVFSGNITMQGPRRLALRGCVAYVFCRSEIWTKLK